MLGRTNRQVYPVHKQVEQKALQALGWAINGALQPMGHAAPPHAGNAGKRNVGPRFVRMSGPGKGMDRGLGQYSGRSGSIKACITERHSGLRQKGRNAK